MHWPNGFKARGEIRTQYAHIIDMVPTVLDALGLAAPGRVRGVSQSPIQGTSFAHTFEDANAATRHLTQYFEMVGHRAIYHDGWRAVCPVPGPSFVEAGAGFGELVVNEAKLRDLDANGWELYHVAEDFCETLDVAAANRPKLLEMIALWYIEAGKYGVLPIDSRGTARLAEERPQLSKDRERYVLYPGTSSVSNKIAPKVLNRSHSITANVDIRDGSEGVLVAQGGASGGYAVYLKDHKLHYAYNYLGVAHYHLVTPEDVPLGQHELRFEFEPLGPPDIAHGKGSPARAQLYVDGELVAETDLPVSIPLDIGITEGLTCGRDDGSTVTDDYQAPYAFTGGLEQVAIDVSGEHIEDAQATMKAVMARQ